MSQNAFAALGVPADLVAVLDAKGITTPTPIQQATLPDSMAGRDVLGRGRTGSGKTYAFCLPLVTRLVASYAKPAARRPRALILAPTRELAIQINETLEPLAKAYGMKTLTIFGGVGQNPQVQALNKGVDIVVACPGRLEDLMGQGHCDLSAVEVTILDEADHMADLGFLPGVKRIMDKTPKQGQRMLFSATLDAGVDVIAKRYLHDPVTHHADSEQSPVETMAHHVLHVDDDEHFAVLVDLLGAPGRTVVFTRTKHRAKKLAKQLNAAGVASVELHGNLGQGARQRNLEAFHSGAAKALVATDIAARGIHVDDVALVIHSDPPVEHKAYLHRSGRTARAGAEGTVVTMMLDEQVKDVRQLTKAAGIRPTTTRVNRTHPLLRSLAPGARAYAAGDANPVAPVQQTPAGGGRRGSGSRAANTASGSGRRAAQGGSARGGAPRQGARPEPGRQEARQGAPRQGAARQATRTSTTSQTSTRQAPARSSQQHQGAGQAQAPAGRRAPRRAVRPQG